MYGRMVDLSVTACNADQPTMTDQPTMAGFHQDLSRDLTMRLLGWNAPSLTLTLQSINISGKKVWSMGGMLLRAKIQSMQWAVPTQLRPASMGLLWKMSKRPGSMNKTTH